QVLAIEQRVPVAVKRSNMNDVLAEGVVLKLCPMEERALGIASAFGPVGVGDFEFAFGGKVGVHQGEVVNANRREPQVNDNECRDRGKYREIEAAKHS